MLTHGASVNVPIAYALAYLYQHSSQIADNPTLYSAPFIVANQAAIAASLWSRALDVSRVLTDDMGYASYGHGPMGSYAISRPDYYGSWSKRSQSNRQSTRQSARQPVRQAEDEIRLRPAEALEHTFNVEGGKSSRSERSPDGIEVSTSVTQSYQRG